MAEIPLNEDAKAVTTESHGKVTEDRVTEIEIKGQNPEHQKPYQNVPLKNEASG